MSTPTTYPNGQVLTSSALTDTAMNIVMQAQTCGMLGINPVDPAQVRVDWQPQGQPDVATPSQDSCYVMSVLEDVDYSRVRDREASGTGPVVQTWSYTRGWRISWDCYGPNSFDRARQIHSALFMDYFDTQFSLVNLYFVSDPSEPTRVPILHNGQWYDHTHFHCVFYEAVTETISDPAVTSVAVAVYADIPNTTDPVATVTVNS